jgi:hypothetical protein
MEAKVKTKTKSKLEAEEKSFFNKITVPTD